MKPVCQVCNKKIDQKNQPWRYATRDIAGNNGSVCFVHINCVDCGLRFGYITGVR